MSKKVFDAPIQTKSLRSSWQFLDNRRESNNQNKFSFLAYEFANYETIKTGSNDIFKADKLCNSPNYERIFED